MLITYKKIIIISCIVCILLGVLLHFAFNFSNSNKIVGIFTPVNESVWEHLKLIFIPFTLFSIFFYIITKKKFSNIFLVTFLANICGMFFIVAMNLLQTLLFTSHSAIFSIISYILSMILCFYIFYLGIYNEDFIKDTKNSNLLGVAAIILFFVFFAFNTFYPLRINIMKDPITKTYGINRYV